MLMTLTCQAPNAPDVGYLLGKHPDSVFARPFSAGMVWVFYPEVTERQVTVALLTEIDPIGLVRGPAALTQLDQYVNDRPYVASSLTSVALHTAFGSALAGRCEARPDLVATRFRWRVTLPAVACDAGADFIARVFAPLGYAVSATRLPLDPRFPAWGEANLYRVTLTGEQTTQALLSHLYVLLPVLDNAKHYYVDAQEAEKLLAHGGAWLAAHPERDLITRRYLRYKRPLIQQATDALVRLLTVEEADTPSAVDTTGPSDDTAQADTLAGADGAADLAHSAPANTSPADAAPNGPDPIATEVVTADAALVETSARSTESTTETTPEMTLHQQRLQAVMDAVRTVGARSLADLGCGEGRLLALALADRSLTRIFGMDVSSAALARARRRLRWETLPEGQRRRIEIALGSLLYRDQRLAGFDAAALVEVIEHLDPPRLRAMEQVVFAHARPQRVIITTPNREYNVHWAKAGAEERLRHGDHRFEWTRAECQAWAERVASAYGYLATWQELGDGDPNRPEIGSPSQLVIFDHVTNG